MKNSFPQTEIAPPVRPAKNKIFHGWWILILSSLINGIGGGTIYHGFTVFFLPVKRDLGVSSAAVSLLYGAARLEGGLDGPIYGYLIDRFGPRRMILIGSSLAGIGFFLLSTVHTFLGFFFIYLFTVSVGMNSGFYHPVSTVVNRWFIRRRGLAFSVLTASGSLGGMVLAPLLSYVVLTYGWRNGAILAGLLILGIAIPSALPIKRSPEEMGLSPDGQAHGRGKDSETHSPSPPTLDVDFTVREALRTFPFWVLMTSISLRIMVTMALNTHFVPLYVWQGLSETAGAYMVSLSAFSSIPIALILGWMGDRWDKAKLCGLCHIPLLIAMMGMTFYQSNMILFFFPIAFSITYATAPLNWALIGDFFGRRSYATVRGIMGIGYGTATFFSPLYAGWVFDRTASYTIVLMTFSAILTISGILFAILRRPAPPRMKRESIPT